MPGLNADVHDKEDEYDLSYDNYSFGFHSVTEYNHSKKNTDIIDLLYNPRLCKFVLLDARGVSTWSCHNGNLERQMIFPKYQNRLLRSMIYCAKHDVYFAICHDFTLQVLNKVFATTCKTENMSMRSVLHIAYNAKNDELISAGIAGTTVWKYQLSNKIQFDQIQPKANFTLVQASQHRDVGGSWCTKLVLLPKVQLVCFCSDNDLYVHACSDLKLMFHLKRAHSASITCVGFCLTTKVLVTGSMDSEVKVWSSNGGHVYTFRGHSQPITALVVNPTQSGLATTASLDGTVKVWSLHAMELFCSLNVFPGGIDWMNFSQENTMWCATEKRIAMYKLHSVATFWGHTRGHVTSLEMAEGPGKSTRVVASGDDGSVRLFSSTSGDIAALCTALPPPVSSSPDSVPSVAYSRNNNLVFILITSQKIWVYTSKTDPACRMTEWNLGKIFSNAADDTTSTTYLRSKKLITKPVLHKALTNTMGYNVSYKCKCMLAIHSSEGFQYIGPHGACSALPRDMLLLGLQDGRILFMDQMIKGRRYFELATSKDPVHAMKFDPTKSCFYTRTGVSTSDIQVWSLPSMQHVIKVTGVHKLSAFLIFENFLASGHKNGTVEINKLKYSKPSKIATEEEQQPVIMTFRASPRDNSLNQLYHKSRVVDLQACTGRHVFASCSDDGAIKVWSYDKVLLTEIWLDDSLSCCLFLNVHADLLVAWKNHIYLINRFTVMSQLTESSEESEASEEESVIYEDPGNRYHDLIDTKEEINLDQYLVPYQFVVKKSDDNIVVHIPDPKRQQESSPPPSPPEYVHALTELYRSPPQSLSSCPCDFDAYGKLEKRNNWLFPEFGDSPNPTPVPSVICLESEEEYEEELQQHVEVEEVDDYVIIPRRKPAKMKVKPADKPASVAFVMPVDETAEEPDETGTSPEEEEVAAVEMEKTDGQAIYHEDKREVRSVAVVKEQVAVVARVASPGMKLLKKVEKTVAGKFVAYEEKQIIKPQQQQQQPQRRQRAQHQQQLATKSSPRFKKYRRQPSGGKFRVPHPDLPEKSMTVKLDEDEVHEADERITPEPVEYAHVVPKTLTYGEPGKEIPLSKNTTMPGRSPRQAYKHSTFERPKYSDALQAVTALKTLTIGGKARANLGRKRSSTRIWNRERRMISDEMLLTAKKPPDSASLEHDNLAENEPVEERKSVMEVYLTRKVVANSDPNTLKENPDVIDSDDAEDLKIAMSESTRSNKFAAKKLRAKNLPIRIGFSEPKLMRHRSAISAWNSENRPKTHTGARLAMSMDQWDDPDRTDPNMDHLDKLAGVYKNDGLQLGDDWQDSMLERYVYLKRQREHRQKSCAEKREMLLRDRKYKILSHRPELSHSDTAAWYEDHDRIASHLLSSPLLTGEREKESEVPIKKPPATPVTVLRSGQRDSSTLEGRPPSRSDTHDVEHEESEPPISYRLSLWKPGTSVFCPRKSSSRKWSLKSRCYSAPFRSSTPQLGSTTQRSETPNRLMVDRPRSSASIPGKTRYILVKTDDPSRKLKTPAPNKLEAELLRQRFPGQHRSVVRAMKKLQLAMDEERESDWDYAGDLADHHLDQDSEESLGIDTSSNHPHHPISFSRKFHGDIAPATSQKSSNTSIATRRSVPPVSACTPMEYCPISVMHRKTSTYTPTSFRA